jgi:hypothetical protein
MIACDSGMRNAPHMPCSTRESTSIGSESDAPHSTEAAVNPPTAQTKTRLRPKRVLSQPPVGIMMAEATM